MSVTIAVAHSEPSTATVNYRPAGLLPAAPSRRRGRLCCAALALLGSTPLSAGSGIDFSERNAIPVINRQIFELRLGATSRSTSSIALGGLLATVLTAGPTSGTTSLFGATLDGGTLFNGGPAPTFTTILATGSAFSLGGGCQRGGFTDFPFINANRPRIARFDAATGAFSVVTPTIAGADFYDSIDCVPSSLGTAFVLSNRTLSRVEVYRDNGSGFQVVNTTGINNVITPFSGGLRSAIALDALAGDVLLSVTRSSGNHEMIGVDLATGTLGAPCLLLSAMATTTFSRPREGAFRFLGKGAGARRLIVSDLDNNGTTDIVTVPAGGCSPTITSAPAGSSNGGNGFNWTGYSTAHDPETHNANILWGDYFYVGPGSNSALDSAVGSPYAGRGGPLHGCSVLDRDFGYSILSLATGSLNTTLDFTLAQTARALNNADRLYRNSLEQPRVIDTDAFATCP